MVVGVIVFAVGVEQAIAHPSGETPAKTALVILGGPAVYLQDRAVQVLALEARALAAPNRDRRVGARGLLEPVVSPLALSAAAAVVVVALATSGSLDMTREPASSTS